MSTIIHRQKSSLRERMKEKLISSGSSIRLPKFLSNEPAAPARYDGTPIFSGYVLPQEFSIAQNGASSSSKVKEQWYIPPDEPPPPPPPPRPERRVTRSRDSEPILLSPRPHNSSKISIQLNGLLSPRISPSSERRFPNLLPSEPVGPVEEPPVAKSLVVHNLRNETHLGAGVEMYNGLLYSLIQTIPETWLTTPRVKESFIPLLRPDQTTTLQQAPLPSELRLIDGFLGHLPELHIIPEMRIPRKPAPSPHAEYKKYLNLSSELADSYERSNPRTQSIYSILVISAIINEISQWMIQQLIHSGTISTEEPPDPSIVQHYIFGGVLLLETHPEEGPQLAFLDSQGEAWMVTLGWLMFKLSEGPGGMPFVSEKKFQRRRGAMVRKIGGSGGGLKGFE